MCSLVCEAKCTKDHDSGKIANAHEKVSETNAKPVDLTRLIDILQSYQDSVSSKWVAALRQLWMREDTNYERYDLVSYVCGQHPIRNPSGWIPTDKPHPAYTAGRRLEAVEVHLDNVDDLIDEVYGRKIS